MPVLIRSGAVLRLFLREQVRLRGLGRFAALNRLVRQKGELCILLVILYWERGKQRTRGQKQAEDQQKWNQSFQVIAPGFLEFVCAGAGQTGITGSSYHIKAVMKRIKLNFTGHCLPQLSLDLCVNIFRHNKPAVTLAS